ncbi:MAG: branched-chain amino acid permease [Halieaceae bacterium]|jgi:predicted branched-subunit amino acid permease|nr:branched-chain amino acid permease [Halieaceae bacterium]
MKSTTSIIRLACRDVAVLFLPALPFALLFGVMVVESGVPQVLGWASSIIMFGGAAQMTLITLIGEGAAVSAAVTTTLIVTARHILYSVTLAPRFQGQPAWFRWLGPYVLIDQVFALTQVKELSDDADFRRYYLAAGFMFWGLWVSFTGLGIILAPIIPETLGIDIAIPLLFLGLLLMAIKRRSQLVTALVSGGAALAFAGMDNQVGLIIAVLIALTVATFNEPRVS